MPLASAPFASTEHLRSGGVSREAQTGQPKASLPGKNPASGEGLGLAARGPGLASGGPSVANTGRGSVPMSSGQFSCTGANELRALESTLAQVRVAGGGNTLQVRSLPRVFTLPRVFRAHVG